MIDKEQLTPKQIEALDLQKQGFTYQQIADKLGITPEAVSYRLTHARRSIARSKGIIVKKTIKTQLTQREAEALALKQQGLTYKQIAEKLGISEKAVDNRLIKARKRIRAKEYLSGQQPTRTTI
jgi:DNA-binding CsgD family transcriptional regulator